MASGPSDGSSDRVWRSRPGRNASEAGVAGSGPQSPTASFLRPGDTCWRVGRAARAAFLIDNEAYFAALSNALRKARRSIWILGWTFDPRARLAPDGQEGPNDPDEIGRILLELAQENPNLDVRLLIWDATLGINGSASLLGHRARRRFARSPVKFRLDASVPFGACHHQKVVVIDESVAFCGGGDLATDRWDTPLHLPSEPRRLLPHRVGHPARHEVTMVVDGEAAVALGSLFRDRWRTAVGERLEDGAQSQTDAWPSRVSADLTDVDVAVSRTVPASRGRPVVAEIRNLTLAGIAGAERTIFLEYQYFTSAKVAAALASRLEEPDGPEVVLILPTRAPSWFDHATMDVARGAALRRICDADVYGRFRAYAPRTVGGAPIVVHSKVAVIDDRLARVGSASLNNRSAGLDTECELALEPADDGGRRAIAAFRDGLLSHYLGLSTDQFARVAAAEGGLIKAIDRLNSAGRLVEIRPQRPTWWERLVSWGQVGDPGDVTENWRLGPRRPER